MSDVGFLQLKIMLPTHILLDEPVGKIIAEAENGSFCLKPKHVDFVSALTPGLLMFVNQMEEEVFVAVDEGILVKCGEEVLVSTRHAVEGRDLATLKNLVESEFLKLDEHERLARTALSRLEAGMVRHFIDLEKIR